MCSGIMHHASCLAVLACLQPSGGATTLARRWHRASTQCRAAPEVAEGSSERGEEWRIEAEASPPTQGDALEERLTEQVEEGTPGGVPDDLAQHSAPLSAAIMCRGLRIGCMPSSVARMALMCAVHAVGRLPACDDNSRLLSCPTCNTANTQQNTRFCCSPQYLPKSTPPCPPCMGRRCLRHARNFGMLPAAAREALVQQPAVVKRRRKRKSVQQLLPVVEERRPLLGDGVRVGLLGIGALAALAAAAFAGRKLLSAQLPKVQKVAAPAHGHTASRSCKACDHAHACAEPAHQARL